MSPTLQAALELLDLGYEPVIVHTGKKQPTDTGWPDQVYTREEITRRYGNKPDLNLGIKLGKLIDVEGDSEQSVADFAELFDGCEVPTTPTFQATNPLPHRFFAWDDRLFPIGKAAIKWKSVEIRLGIEPAQTLLPPSVTNGVEREWTNKLSADCLPAPLPDAVIERLLAANAAAEPEPPKATKPVKPLNTDLPGDDFCSRATWAEILEPHGWKFVGEANGIQHWQRPGKSDGLSGTTGHCESKEGRDLFYCFSENAPPLEANKSYSKFALYAALNHANDFKSAAAALAEQGYGKKKKLSAASKSLIDIVSKSELFHNPAGDAYITVKVDEHLETYPIESKQFKRYLEFEYYRMTEGAPSSKALTEAIGVIAACARYKGQEIPVHTRIAGTENSIYIDLCNPKWEAVEITTNGWRVVSRPPVKFRRTNGMLPLPYPQFGGSIDELRPFVNVDEDSWPLLVSGLVAAMHPVGPYPVMIFKSEHGSCKSTTMRVCRQLIDPSFADLRSTPNDVQGLMLAATNGWFVALDNLSKVPDWLSDALCRLSTGGGLSTRALYTNDEEKLFNCKRPVMVTGIAELTTREDFLDRSILIHCPEMPEGKRIDERTLYINFEQARPRIMGAIFTAASAALCNLSTTKLQGLPRMADFALWATAAESGLGWKPGSFMHAYDRNRSEADDVALDNPLADAIRKMLEPGSVWTGSATPLLETLNTLSTPLMRASDEWPRSANSLSNKLNRMKVNLRKAGINVSQHRRTFTLSQALSA